MEEATTGSDKLILTEQLRFRKLKLSTTMGLNFPYFLLIPSPGDGKSLQIEGIGLNDQEILPIEIVDMKGIVVWKGVIPITTPGRLHEELVFGNALAPGIYIVRGGATSLLTRKIVIK